MSSIFIYSQRSYHTALSVKVTIRTKVRIQILAKEEGLVHSLRQRSASEPELRDRETPELNLH